MISEKERMQFDGCQVPCLPGLASGMVEFEPDGWKMYLKRSLALPWNRVVKVQAKRFTRWMDAGKAGNKVAANGAAERSAPVSAALKAGDWVRVKPLEEVEATLDRWKELKGCAFLEYMSQYCGTRQRVLQPLERFLDERDYKVKKCRGVVLLEGVICRGTPAFGRCDRCCFLFWREEWLERIPAPGIEPG